MNRIRFLSRGVRFGPCFYASAKNFHVIRVKVSRLESMYMSEVGERINVCTV